MLELEGERGNWKEDVKVLKKQNAYIAFGRFVKVINNVKKLKRDTLKYFFKEELHRPPLPSPIRAMFIRLFVFKTNRVRAARIFEFEWANLHDEIFTRNTCACVRSPVGGRRKHGKQQTDDRCTTDSGFLVSFLFCRYLFVIFFRFS